MRDLIRTFDLPKLSSCCSNCEVDDASVYDVLEKGLNDLMDLCDVVTEKFTVARDEFRAR